MFSKILDDPSGDSFIENPYAPNKDSNLTISYYKRNSEQNEMLGLTVY
jgi:zinc finger protein